MRGVSVRRAAAVVAVGLALLLIACVFGAGPLFVVALGLVAVGVGTPAWVAWSARGARVSRELGDAPVVEGTLVRTTIAVRRGLLSGGWGRFELVDAASGTRTPLGGPGSSLRGRRAARLRADVRFARRGAQELEPPWLRVADPLELASARREADAGAVTVLVLPRTEPVRWDGTASGVRLGAGTAEGAGEAFAATDLQGLRPYRAGTPASRIHWPALARGAGLVERQLRADAEERPLVVLDARGRDGDRGPVDAAVRAAASIVSELARAGGCAVLLPGQPRATVVERDLVGWSDVLARLAIAGTDSDPARDRAPRLGASGGRAGPLVYVSAMSHPRLAGALSGAGGRGGVVLVVPVSEVVEGRPRGAAGRCAPVLSACGCRGFRLGGAFPGARGRAEPAGAAGPR